MKKLLILASLLQVASMAFASGENKTAKPATKDSATDSEALVAKITLYRPIGADSLQVISEDTVFISPTDTVFSGKPVSPDSYWGNSSSEAANDQEQNIDEELNPTGWHLKPVHGPQELRFVWGADFGSTVDLSGADMSSIDINAAFGVGYKWLSLGGIGAGANIMVSNSSRAYPIYAIFRTDFSKLVKPMFLDLRGGIALIYLSGNEADDGWNGNFRQTGGYISPSIGFNLASGRTFRSYITLGYTYVSRKDVTRSGDGDAAIPFKPLNMATVRLGISF